MTRNIKLVLAYDGADFHGWQIQPGLATIQGALAEAIARVTGEQVLPQGSGRTDAGVHALGQVASFQLAGSLPAENLARALNDVLPLTVRVLSAQEVADDFHARHSAKRKLYEYRLWRGAVRPPFLARYVTHHPYPLREELMAAAAAEVLGEHDFTSFAAVDPESGEAAKTEARSNVRTIHTSEWLRRQAEQGDELVYRIEGSGFLHHMVRNLVGTFLLVGKGSIAVADIRDILAARSRASAGPTAPAEGLYLVAVDY